MKGSTFVIRGITKFRVLPWCSYVPEAKNYHQRRTTQYTAPRTYSSVAVIDEKSEHTPTANSKRPFIQFRVANELKKSNYMFPVEIWEIILQKIPDPSPLMVLQEVCSTWYCIIEKIIKNFNWKRTCMHEIGRSHVHDIMIKAFPSHCLDDYPVIIDEEIWRGTFYSFSKWIMILQAEAVLTKIHVSEKFKENEFITCTAASSDNVAVGTDSGSIYFYNIFNVNEPSFTATHGEPIDQIEFWYNGDATAIGIYLRNARPLLLSYKNNSELKLFLRQDMAYGLSSKSERVLKSYIIPDDSSLSLRIKFYVTYYNAIIFIIGVIHIIYAPTADCLLHLNFDNVKSKSIRISNDEPIISMNIAEAEKDPYIFVATKTKNYIVNFI
ncbi:hypothetical protein G9C98_002295 [Cotesia typhae]|uniref:F-box domain-containing protein n=1 Tax=Cotesia typhae TaxID=2053667 RepID=A0A8J5R477_9HYME|nr:hypothetical protein G9C98_002295 [Cotesia typhae]